MQWTSEVAFQDPSTDTFLGSPSIVRLADRTLLASFDYFGPEAPQSDEGVACLTSLYASQDDGATWVPRTHFIGQWWSNLFLHGGDVYIFGTSAYCGDIVIRRSTDSGHTWTRPVDRESGLLFEGGPGETEPNYHCAPMPVVKHDGRLYRAFEDKGGDETVSGEHYAFVVSCDADRELLDADNWVMSNNISSRRLPDTSTDGSPPNWREGNVTVMPDGELVNILRINGLSGYDRAAVVHIRDEGRRISFDESDILDLPGGHTKFTIRRDPETEIYWMLSNPTTNPDYHTRNELSLFASRNLRKWHHTRTLLNDEIEPNEEASINNTGFQYVDWQFDGDDIIYLVRTSYDGAHNYHDSNRITYDSIINYRELTPELLQ